MINFRMPAVAATVVALATLGACQREDKDLKDRLDKMNDQLETIGRKVDTVAQRGPAAAAPAAPQQGRPDPTAVYAVPIDGNPAKGPTTAKVTIVEAAEFA
jgi:protein-disulfide isomerase